MMVSFFLFSCGSKKLVFSKDGQSDSRKEEIIVSIKDIRKLYDSKNYKELFDILQNITEMKDMNDYMLHFFLIHTAFVLDRTSKIEAYYLKSNIAFFYKGVISFEKNDYDSAIKFLKISKENNPVVLYLIGASYFFKEDRTMALGYLKLSLDGSDTPWPFLTYASLLELSGNTENALIYLDKAMNKTYDFENNLIADILAKKTNILFNKNDYEGALFHAMQLYQRDKLKALTLTDPGDIYLAEGKIKEAIDFWNKNLNDLQMPDYIKSLITSKLEVVKRINENDKDRDHSH